MSNISGLRSDRHIGFLKYIGLWSRLLGDILMMMIELLTVEQEDVKVNCSLLSLIFLIL